MWRARRYSYRAFSCIAWSVRWKLVWSALEIIFLPLVFFLRLSKSLNLLHSFLLFCLIVRPCSWLRSERLSIHSLFSALITLILPHADRLQNRFTRVLVRYNPMTLIQSFPRLLSDNLTPVISNEMLQKRYWRLCSDCIWTVFLRSDITFVHLSALLYLNMHCSGNYSLTCTSFSSGLFVFQSCSELSVALFWSVMALSLSFLGPTSPTTWIMYFISQFCRLWRYPPLSKWLWMAWPFSAIVLLKVRLPCYWLIHLHLQSVKNDVLSWVELPRALDSSVKAKFVAGLYIPGCGVRLPVEAVQQEQWSVLR